MPKQALTDFAMSGTSPTAEWWESIPKKVRDEVLEARAALGGRRMTVRVILAWLKQEHGIECPVRPQTLSEFLRRMQ